MVKDRRPATVIALLADQKQNTLPLLRLLIQQAHAVVDRIENRRTVIPRLQMFQSGIQQARVAGEILRQLNLAVEGDNGNLAALLGKDWIKHVLQAENFR